MVVEQNDEWLLQDRYTQIEGMAALATPSTEETKDYPQSRLTDATRGHTRKLHQLDGSDRHLGTVDSASTDWTSLKSSGEKCNPCQLDEHNRGILLRQQPRLGAGPRLERRTAEKDSCPDRESICLFYSAARYCPSTPSGLFHPNQNLPYFSTYRPEMTMSSKAGPPTRRMIRRHQLREIVPLADSTIYEMERAESFPRRLHSRLGALCDLGEVEAWLALRRVMPVLRAPPPDVRRRRTRPVKAPDRAHDRHRRRNSHRGILLPRYPSVDNVRPLLQHVPTLHVVLRLVVDAPRRTAILVG